ncbi:MAG: hypothetical protein ACXWXF_12490 [Aeromicrobium sp.]
MAFRTTGSVPQLGTAAALAEGLTSALGLADAAGVDGAVEVDGATEAPGAQALATMARAEIRIPGPRTNRRRVNDPWGLALNI